MNFKKLVLICFAFVGIILSTTNGQSNNNSNQDLRNGINVTFGGTFPAMGSFVAQSGERLDQLVTRIYTDAKKAQAQFGLVAVFKDPALRGIIIKRSGGEELKVDLLKYRLTGDFTNNPYLKNDDVVLFPPMDITRNFFLVEGAVNEPGKFQFVEGDNIQDAIALSRGINPAYENVIDVIIYRLNYDGKVMQEIKTTINGNDKLKAGDRIRIIADETNKKDYQVLVLGEVAHPGYTPITRENATLRDVILRAGGFLPTAWKRNVRLYSAGSLPADYLKREFNVEYDPSKNPFFRLKADEITLVEKLSMQRMMILDEQDTSNFYFENQLKSMISSQICNLEMVDTAALERILNMPVKEGDIITIPRKEKTVYIFGQVKNPGRLEYLEGKGVEYYISLAGGRGELAQKNIKIIKIGTKEWISYDPDEPLNLEPGDYIYIPKKDVHSYDYYVRYGASYLSIIGSLATVVLLVVQLTK